MFAARRFGSAGDACSRQIPERKTECSSSGHGAAHVIIRPGHRHSLLSIGGLEPHRNRRSRPRLPRSSPFQAWATDRDPPAPSSLPTVKRVMSVRFRPADAAVRAALADENKLRAGFRLPVCPKVKFRRGCKAASAALQSREAEGSLSGNKFGWEGPAMKRIMVAEWALSLIAVVFGQASTQLLLAVLLFSPQAAIAGGLVNPTVINTISIPTPSGVAYNPTTDLIYVASGGFRRT